MLLMGTFLMVLVIVMVMKSPDILRNITKPAAVAFKFDTSNTKRKGWIRIIDHQLVILSVIQAQDEMMLMMMMIEFVGQGRSSTAQILAKLLRNAVEASLHALEELAEGVAHA